MYCIKYVYYKIFNPIYSLLNGSIYYLVFIIYDYIKDSEGELKFLISLSSEIFEIIGFFIYLEIIELRFCGLNKNTRINIILRGKSDSEQTRNNSICSADNIYNVNEDLLNNE